MFTNNPDFIAVSEEIIEISKRIRSAPIEFPRDEAEIIRHDLNKKLLELLDKQRTLPMFLET